MLLRQFYRLMGWSIAWRISRWCQVAILVIFLNDVIEVTVLWLRQTDRSHFVHPKAVPAFVELMQKFYVSKLVAVQVVALSVGWTLVNYVTYVSMNYFA